MQEFRSSRVTSRGGFDPKGAGCEGTALYEGIVATGSNGRQTGPDLRKMLHYKMSWFRREAR